MLLHSVVTCLIVVADLCDGLTAETNVQCAVVDSVVQSGLLGCAP